MRRLSTFSFLSLIIVAPFLFWAIPTHIEIGNSNYVQLSDLSSSSNPMFNLVDSGGVTVQKLLVSFNFVVDTYPETFATIFNSDTSHNNGMSFNIDRLGDLYISIGSIEQHPDASQQLLVAKLIPPGISTSVYATFNYPSKQLSIVVNGVNVALISSDPTRAFLFDDCLVHVGLVKLWGTNNHQFQGEIDNFSMRFSKGETVISLINLRLFVLMAGVLLATVSGQWTNSSQEECDVS